MSTTIQRRPRRQYTPEFRAEAVKMVLEEGRSMAQVAKDLGLTCSALENWENHQLRVLRRPVESTQYASKDYQRALAAWGIRCSMSRKGNCRDNAVVESFFSTLKTELVPRVDFLSRAAAKSALRMASHGGRRFATSPVHRALPCRGFRACTPAAPLGSGILSPMNVRRSPPTVSVSRI